MDLSRGVTYEAHARRRMRRRKISEAQVETVLRSYHTSYPAERLPGRSHQSTVYVGSVDGRELKVYVLEGSSPPHVMTVAGKGEDE